MSTAVQLGRRQIVAATTTLSRRVSLARVGTSTIAVFDCVLLLGLLGLYLKHALLSQQWQAIARFLGRHDASDLALIERAGFFFNDLVLNLVLVPTLATIAAVTIFRAYRIHAALLATVILSTCYFIDLRAQTEVGQYIARDMLGDLVGWAAASPAASWEYLTFASIAKLLVLIAALIAVATVGLVAERVERSSPTIARACRRALLAVAAGILLPAALLAPASLAWRINTSSFTASAVGLAARALLTSPGDLATATSYDEAMESLRRVTHTPAVDATHPYVGDEQDSNLVIFVMETGPARALDLALEGRSLPGAGSLYDHAFLASHHHTTHPYSSDAMYSMLSGFYPQARRNMLRRAAPDSRSGLMQAVPGDATLRGVYLPSLYQIESDDAMYRAFGADLVYASDRERQDPLREVADQRAAAIVDELVAGGSQFEPDVMRHLQARLGADLQALERMKADVTGAVKSGHRYSVMFFPEIGHAPWLALRGESTVLERGRTLIQLQDLWLKEIVDLLKSLNRLSRTVIVFTADHGIRTRVEDPALPAGKVSEYMFRVPLLVFAPHTIQQPVMIDAPTSHIDLAPTLLSLFGRVDRAARMSGLPLWQRTSANRIFFLASAYGGADGFTQDGVYYMRQALSGATYRSPTFAFDDHQQITAVDPAAAFVEGALTEQDSVQRQIVARAVSGASNATDAGMTRSTEPQSR
jgi:hypothetical protein